MSTENMSKFLSLLPAEGLARLQAHAEDGKLFYDSCCCFISAPYVNHALIAGYCKDPSTHLEQTRMLPYALEAEAEFLRLFDPTNARKVTLELIAEEWERRRLESIEAEAETNSVVGRDPVYDANGRH